MSIGMFVRVYIFIYIHGAKARDAGGGSVVLLTDELKVLHDTIHDHEE